MTKNRVVVIGIDGGTFDIIRPMVARGELPNLGSILTEGVSAGLDSTIPSVTLPAWISFMTGMNPGKLGIFYLVSDLHATYDEGRPANPSNVPAKSLWHYLTEAGKKVLCAIPFDFNPHPINGVMVCKGASEELKCYPPERCPEMRDILARIRNEGDWDGLSRRLGREPRTVKERHFIDMEKDISISTEMMRSLTLRLMDESDWDMVLTVFTAPDKAEHSFWSCMDETHPIHDGEERKMYGDVIPEAYRRVDSAIGEILAKAGDATVVILSDHGMSPVHKFFQANRWLLEKGFLNVKGDRERPSLHRERIPLKRILEKLGIRTSRVPDWSVPIVRRRELPVPEEVDWSRTRAYATAVGINVNLKGREPHGIVTPGEYELVRSRIRKELLGLTDPETGEKIVARVHRKEEIYSGPRMDDAHDLVYVFANPHYLTRKTLFPSAVFEPILPQELCTAQHFNHAAKGIFLAKGEDFRSGGRCDDVSILDILPTVLHLLGVPLPRDLDGTILWGALREGLEGERPPVYVDPTDFQGCGGELTSEEEDEVRKQLKKLGYI